MFKRVMMFAAGAAFGVASLITCGTGGKDPAIPGVAAGTPSAWEYATLRISNSGSFWESTLYFNQPAGEEVASLYDAAPFRGCAPGGGTSKDSVGGFMDCVLTALGSEGWELVGGHQGIPASDWRGFILKRPK